MPDEISIGGRKYSVEKVLDKSPTLDTERVYYRLTGVRGARYFTMRNVKRPELMFIVPEKMGSKVMDRIWLTDKNGPLEVL